MFGDGILLQQLAVAFQIEPCVFQQCLIPHELPFGLHQFRLERARIEFGEQLARFHQLAFREMQFDEFPIDTAAYRRGVGGIDGSQRKDLKRCIFLYDSRHPDGGRTATRWRSPVFRDDPVNAPDHDDGEQTDDGNQKRTAEFDFLQHKDTVMTGW